MTSLGPEGPADPCAPELIEELHSARAPVNSLSAHPDDTQLATGCQDGVVVLWHLQPQARAFRYVGHQAAVSAVDFAPNGSLVVSASLDRTVRLWVPTVRGGSTVIHAHQGGVRGAAFVGTGDRVVTGSDDKTVKTWDVATQKVTATFAEHTNWVRCVGASGDGRIGGSGGDDKAVKLWDFGARQPRSIHTLLHHGDSVTGIAFAPGGHSVATCSADRTIKLFDLRTFRLLQHYDAHSDVVRGVVFHPTGDFLTSCSQDSTIKVWDLRVGYLFYTLSAHAGPVTAVAFSANGQTFWSAGVDQKVLRWQTNFHRDPNGPVAKERSTAPPEANGRPKAPPKKASRKPPLRPQEPNPLPLSATNGAAQPPPPPALPADGPPSAAETAACLEYFVRQMDILTQTVRLLEGRVSGAEAMAAECFSCYQRLDQRQREDRKATADAASEVLEVVKVLSGRLEALEGSTREREEVLHEQLRELRQRVTSEGRGRPNGPTADPTFRARPSPAASTLATAPPLADRPPSLENSPQSAPLTSPDTEPRYPAAVPVAPAAVPPPGSIPSPSSTLFGTFPSFPSSSTPQPFGVPSPSQAPPPLSAPPTNPADQMAMLAAQYAALSTRLSATSPSFEARFSQEFATAWLPSRTSPVAGSLAASPHPFAVPAAPSLQLFGAHPSLSPNHVGSSSPLPAETSYDPRSFGSPSTVDLLDASAASYGADSLRADGTPPHHFAVPDDAPIPEDPEDSLHEPEAF